MLIALMVAVPLQAHQVKPSPEARSRRGQFEEMGIPLAKRKDIGRQFLADEGRAYWEAERLYLATSGPEESSLHRTYSTARMRQLWEETASRENLPAEHAKHIRLEMAVGEWFPINYRPPLDHEAIRKHLRAIGWDGRDRSKAEYRPGGPTPPRMGVLAETPVDQKAVDKLLAEAREFEAAGDTLFATARYSAALDLCAGTPQVKGIVAKIEAAGGRCGGADGGRKGRALR